MSIDYLVHIGNDAAAIGTLLRNGAGTEPVPACPGWTAADLVAHLGGVHRWARHIVTSGQPTRERESPPGADIDALAGWLTDGADALCTTLASTDPAAPCWTFGMPPGTAGFWRRRQAMETVVHRCDVQQAAGLPTSVDQDLAAGGVSEIVDFLYPRQVALGRTGPLTMRLTLAASDIGQQWEIGELDTEEVVVEGTVSALFLWLWRRAVPPVDVRVQGPSAAIATLAASALVP